MKTVHAVLLTAAAIFAGSASADEVLFDQSGATNSSYAQGGLPGLLGMVADDFVVPTGKQWTITELQFIGVRGRIDAASLAVEIRSNEGGRPGSTVLASFAYALPGIDPIDLFMPQHYVFSLPTPLVLAEGTYWLAVVTDRDGRSDAIFFWGEPPAVSGYVGQRSVDSGATWSPWVTDFAFALVGREESSVAAQIQTVQATLAAFTLQTGIATSFDAKLQAALAALAATDTASACQALQDVGNQARALGGTRFLTAEQAATVIGEVMAIRSRLACQ